MIDTILGCVLAVLVLAAVSALVVFAVQEFNFPWPWN